ncbi:oligosaccharide flippase family protein [Candidatus Accumulibacter sp. ACC012]|uniref:oligosaccharide flippase family protein n=1 Tax=Candidatus Accumulibacter sp. ACC012 TaxID=2823332 RepID=UPI0025BB005E|nr:oligosaccharide flippase family protein [Candidatus Accumulibacter sp. ACC012]
MSFKRNVFATYVSQLYTTLIGIAILPVYIQYMGAEAYGLIGFYAMLQAWFHLLDMGLAPTMARQTAQFNGGAITALTLRRLLRALEAVFIGVAIVGVIALLAGADTIATSWLKVEHLPVSQVSDSIRLMAGIIGLRWIAGLYRGAIGGFEQQVWLGKLNAGAATARFVLVLVIFETLGTTPLHFFAYQLLVACVETALLAQKAYRLMPVLGEGESAPWSLTPLRNVMKFSLTVAFTSSVWVFVTQTDKLVLSKMLPLSTYAYFTLGVLVASGVTIMSGPISTALLPRLSRLHAQGDEQGLLELYRQATQFVVAIAAPLAIMLACFAEPLLVAWTGSAETAQQAAPVLRLYALGNGVLSLGAFPYYLQFAKGNLRLHMIGNLLFVVLLIPSIVAATYWYGATGAGWAWLGANTAYFLLWVPLVHHRLAPGLHWQWLGRDIAPVVVLTALASIAASELITLPAGRGWAMAAMFATGMFVLSLGAVGSQNFRNLVREKLAANK